MRWLVQPDLGLDLDNPAIGVEVQQTLLNLEEALLDLSVGVDRASSAEEINGEAARVRTECDRLQAKAGG